MKKLGLLVGLMLASSAQAASFKMDCSKPMYVGVGTPASVIQAVTDKGASVVIAGKDGTPEGGVVLAYAARVTHVAKYFGPANWTEYTCQMSLVLGSKQNGNAGKSRTRAQR